MSILIYTSDTDPAIGDPQLSVHQSSERGPMPQLDRISRMEQEIKWLRTSVARLSEEVEILRARTWWSMLKDWLEGLLT